MNPSSVSLFLYSYSLLHNELYGVLRFLASLHHGEFISIHSDGGDRDGLTSQDGGGQDDHLGGARRRADLVRRDHDRLGGALGPLQKVDGLHGARVPLRRGGQGGQHLGPLHHLLGVGQVPVQADVLVQVGARAEGGGAVGAGVGLLPAVGAGVLREAGRHAEALAAHPAAEGSQAAVDALVVLQVGQLAETLVARGTLDRWRKRKEAKRGYGGGGGG